MFGMAQSLSSLGKDDEAIELYKKATKLGSAGAKNFLKFKKIEF